MILFPGPEGSRISERLVEEAADNIPFHNDSLPEEMDRIRFSILKLISQNPKNEEIAFNHAKLDWRDLFMAAGFGYSATEHERWYDEIIRKHNEG